MKTTGVILLAVAAVLFVVSVFQSANTIENVTPEILDAGMSEMWATMKHNQIWMVSSYLLGAAGVLSVIVGCLKSDKTSRITISE